MNDLRKAAQMALETIDWMARGNYDGHAREVCEALRAALAQPEYPLPESLYPDSKDWAAADYASRVEWLHFMYEAKKREVAQLETAMPEPEQEPVGWFESPHGAFRANPLYKLEFPSQLLSWSVPLYTAPPQRKPLTEADIKGIFDLGLSTWKLSESTVEFARAIEKAHGVGGEHD